MLVLFKLNAVHRISRPGHRPSLLVPTVSVGKEGAVVEASGMEEGGRGGLLGLL